MIKSTELKNTIKELVKTNFETLDAKKMSVIVKSIYGIPDKGYVNAYKYFKDGNEMTIFMNGLPSDSDGYPGITIETRKYDVFGREWFKSLNNDLIPFANYLIKKWKYGLDGNRLLKSEVYRITSDFVVQYDTVEETVSHFIEWVKQTHSFMSSNTDDQQFADFLGTLTNSSILGEAYAKAVITWNGGLISAVENKQIPSSSTFYSILKKILNRREWDGEEINKWKKAIY